MSGKLKCSILASLLDYNLIHLQDQEYSPGNLATIFATDVENIKSTGGEYIGEVGSAILGFMIAFIFALTKDVYLPCSLFCILPL